MNPKRPAPRHIMIKIANIKDKKRILKAAREEQRVTYKIIPIRLLTDFSAELCRPEESGMLYLKC